MDSGLRRALARARDGKALDLDEATVLLAARGDALEALLDVAGRVRDAGLVAAGRPGVITYSRKVFIPLTRLCRDRCHYCTFATVPGRLPAPYLSVDEVVAIAAQGAALGCKEALFTLGDRPRTAGRRRASGSRRPATTARCPTCAPARSRCSRRPACCRTSTRASCRGRSSSGSSRWPPRWG
jgi:FO synthase